MRASGARPFIVKCVLDALASASWKRPWALPGVALALLAAISIDRLGPGSTRVDGPAGPDLVVATGSGGGVPSKVSAVALKTISANVEADPSVASVRRAQGRRDDSTAVLVVTLASDDGGERRDAVERIAAEIDPGPLQVYVGGETAELLEAGSSLGGDLWRLELLALPLALLVLAGGLGLRLIGAPVISAASGVAGSLAGLGAAGLVVDPALLAAVPGVVIGLALGVELPALLLARCEDEARLGEPAAALRSAVSDGLGPVAFAAALAPVAAAGLLATGFEPAGSFVLACALAAAFALLATILVVPALFALELRARARREDPGADDERRLPRALAALPRVLARRRWRAGAGALVAALALLALAYPALDGRSLPLGASDLPDDGPAARAAAIVEAEAAEHPATRRDRPSASAGPRAEDADSVFDELPLAAAIAAAALALAFGLRSRSVRAALLGPASLLPAAAACGAVTFVFQQGALLPSSLGDPHELSNAALAATVTALAAVSSTRSAAAIEASRFERELDQGAPGVAERAAGATLPAALMGTLVAGAGVAVLLGADLRAAQELGLGVALGLVVDLVLVRSPAIAALAR